jgi:transcriptional regulator GlxA family with amidase domain
MSLMKTGPIHVGIVVCPNFCALDVFGVYTVFGVPPLIGLRPDIHVHFIGKDTEEFSAVPPFPMRATTTYSKCPQPLDVLALGAMPPTFFDDEEGMDFVAEAGKRASYLIGVCGGVQVLGAAGLLKGYRATSNFHAVDQLGICGAIPTKGHVVVDRNRYTSGPAIGAYDASLMILGEMCGPEVAREHELHLQHMAEPPYRTGRPELAGEELTQRALHRLRALTGEAQDWFAASCRKRGVMAA